MPRFSCLVGWMLALLFLWPPIEPFASSHHCFHCSLTTLVSRAGQLAIHLVIYRLMVDKILHIAVIIAACKVHIVHQFIINYMAESVPLYKVSTAETKYPSLSAPARFSTTVLHVDFCDIFLTYGMKRNASLPVHRRLHNRWRNPHMYIIMGTIKKL